MFYTASTMHYIICIHMFMDNSGTQVEFRYKKQIQSPDLTDIHGGSKTMSEAYLNPNNSNPNYCWVRTFRFRYGPTQVSHPQVLGKPTQDCVLNLHIYHHYHDHHHHIVDMTKVLHFCQPNYIYTRLPSLSIG